MIEPRPQTALPSPHRTRWQPLRIGLVELFHYDVEEFWFRDGHLLLRGNNGTGKSKVLSLTLPFLLDANLGSSRIEPDGDRTKRMEWNLLMNGRHDRRIGYAWIEFGRRDEAGETLTLTLGCGLKAVAGRAGVDPWYFITSQRIGAELWLTTPEKTVLTRERLIEAIGTRGQVFPSAESYRRAVDEKLFRLGTVRYEALVDTLIQLRQPQLSKSPNERRLSDALTQALPPLDRAALEDVAEAMSELDDIRRGLAEIEAMRKAIASFGGRYRRYAQVATRRKARVLRQAQTEYDNSSRDVNASQQELEKARVKVERSRSRQQELEELLAADGARLRVLQSDPVMRDATRLADARTRERECRRLAEEAGTREKHAHSKLLSEAEATRSRKIQSEKSRAQLSAAHVSATDLSREAGILDDHTRAMSAFELPDGVAGVSVENISAVAKDGRAAEKRRREQVETVRKRLRAVETATQARDREHEVRALRAEAFDGASESARRASTALQEECVRLLEVWRVFTGAARILRVPGPDDQLDALELWHQSLTGPNPMRAALDQARMALEELLASREAQIAEQRRQLTGKRDELQAEKGRLETGEIQLPPAAYTRDPTVRTQLAGAPLWQLIDFAPHVNEETRAGLESGLEASGLLDAWVLPDGVLVDRRTNDVFLTARTAHLESLADWVQPAVPAQGAGSEIQAERVREILASIACSEQEPPDAETWLSTRGEYRVGSASGAWLKPQAHFIGHSARERARRARLDEISRLVAELNVAIGECQSASEQVAAERREARQEFDRAPSDDMLLRLHAAHGAAEHQRREAQVRLGEADAKLAKAEHALARARDDLALDARDLGLPATASELDHIDRSLSQYLIGLAELVAAMRDHRAAVLELKQQTEREQQAIEALEAAQIDHRDRQTQLTAAVETVNALQATVGKKVDDLLKEIEAAEDRQRVHDRELKDTRAALVMASTQRATAEQKHKDLAEKQEERLQSRRVAAEGLQSFTTHTGFLSISVPDLELPAGTAAWGIDAALTVARRAEASLSEIPADEPDWERIQRDVGMGFTELQSTMSTQGHSATAEPSDHGLIVRIVFQQRPERPDALERRLDAELEEQRLILSTQERALLEEHLEKEVAANLQRMIRETEERVAAINAELYERPTSTGMRYRLVWQPLPESDDNAVPGLALARKRLLNTSADAWSADDRRQVGEFLRARIEAERQRDERGTLFDTLAKALDYRLWHCFGVERNQDRQWRPLSGPASSGERALGLTVPLFAAASSHYESASPHAPRLVLLDEAFAGIDDEARANCMGLIREFDLDFVMTSEREWGCYAELPGLSICQLVRREGMDAVFVSRWSWDGVERRAESDLVQRYPETAEAED